MKCDEPADSNEKTPEISTQRTVQIFTAELIGGE